MVGRRPQLREEGDFYFHLYKMCDKLSNYRQLLLVLLLLFSQQSFQHVLSRSHILFTDVSPQKSFSVGCDVASGLIYFYPLDVSNSTMDELKLVLFFVF